MMICLSQLPAQTSTSQGQAFLHSLSCAVKQGFSTLQMTEFLSEESEEITLQDFLCARSTVYSKGILGFSREIT